jgi:ABC-type antimicrobial peptide transport system permease subunit
MVSLYLIARRRSFELAALRALGFGPRKVLAAAIAEQSILAAFAIGLGVTLGVLGARLGLPSIPEFADGATVPALLIRLDPERILAVAGLMSALLGVGIAVSGRLLTSSARPVRLREGQA